MKRLRFLVLGSLLLGALFTFVFAGSASAASGCTPSWHVVQSQVIPAPGYGGGSRYAGPGVPYNGPIGGTVNLLRDGCGDVQATIQTQPGVRIDSINVYLETATTTFGSGTTATPVYSGYGGVSVSAVGVFLNATGDAPSVGVGQTANDSGN